MILNDNCYLTLCESLIHPYIKDCSYVWAASNMFKYVQHSVILLIKFSHILHFYLFFCYQYIIKYTAPYLSLEQFETNFKTIDFIILCVFKILNPVNCQRRIVNSLCFQVFRHIFHRALHPSFLDRVLLFF